MAIRLTLVLLGLLAILPLAAAGVIALLLAGNVNGGRTSYGFVGFAVLLAIWPFLTAVGISLLRTWARYSLLSLAVILCGVASFCLVSDILALLKGPLSSAISYGVAVSYLLLLALGIWWLVYFSRASTKALFRNPPG